MPPEPTRPLPRRTMLTASGTAVLAAVAACSSGATTAGGTTATSPASRDSATPSSRASAPTTASGKPGGSTSSTSSSGTAAADEPAPGGTPVASVADVQAAGSIVVGENENAYLLAYTGDTVVAHTAVCTHQRCTVGASGLCPCHQSRFDVATGAVINGPALRPLVERGVTVSGGQVYLT